MSCSNSLRENLISAPGCPAAPVAMVATGAADKCSLANRHPPSRSVTDPMLVAVPETSALSIPGVTVRI